MLNARVEFKSAAIPTSVAPSSSIEHKLCPDQAIFISLRPGAGTVPPSVHAASLSHLQAVLPHLLF